jgi:hypothetical protein
MNLPSLLTPRTASASDRLLRHPDRMRPFHLDWQRTSPPGQLSAHSLTIVLALEEGDTK